MKTISTISILVICSALIFSCKKKSTETPAPVPAPVNNTPVGHVNKMTASVNGISWAMASKQGIEGTNIFASSGSYNFGCQNAFTNPYTSISLWFRDTTGTFALIKYGTFNGSYQDENLVFYAARTGTINITACDTIGAGTNIIQKLKATFSFSTDTVNGKSFTVTGGIIDYENKY